MSENRPPRMPTNEQPLNAAPRKTVGPAVLTLMLLVLIAVVFCVIFLLR
jgi:hypothetical protein